MAQPRIAIITGGAGFIGSHMVDLCLSRDMQVRVIDNLIGGRLANLAHHERDSRLSVEQRDIRSYAPGDKFFAGATHVFHFGGIGDLVPSIEQPVEYMSVNTQGTVAMLECARHAGTIAKFVYAASSSCYGLASVPTTEDHPIVPEHPYALSKNLGEQACFHWYKVYRLPINTIRIFNAYGTRSRTSGAYGAVFGVFLKQKLADKPFTVVGDGTQRRDFLYVTDVAHAFLAAGETSITGRTWNVGAGDPQSVNRLVELLGGPVVYVPKRPGEPDCTWADITRITTELGWRPEISFTEGVAKVVANIDYWRDAPLWDPESIARSTKTWFDYLGKTVTTIFDYETLTSEFNHKLVTQLRSHGSGSEYLETWVPDEDPVMSILNMVEAALSAGLNDMRIHFGVRTMTDVQRATLVEEVSRLAHAEISASNAGYELAVRSAGT